MVVVIEGFASLRLGRQGDISGQRCPREAGHFHFPFVFRLSYLRVDAQKPRVSLHIIYYLHAL